MSKLLMTSSPHIKSRDTVRSVMLDVIIALIPALIMAIVYFGPRALLLTLVSVISCVGFEFLYRYIMKKSLSIGNLSAVVTGILIAFNLPVTASYWMAIIGAFFAIVIVKELFGGIGKNFVNPALAARAFLFSYPDLMTTWAKPFSKIGLFVSDPADIVTTATPLVSLKLRNGTLPAETISQMFFGEMGGTLGETAAVVLILGGLYLLIRKVITLHIPLSYIGTVAFFTYFFSGANDGLFNMGANILSGGLLLGAIFMATDYSTSPVTKKGQLIFGIGCGLLTVFIRYFGGYPEGVSFAILIMNCLVFLIDKYIKPRRYGTGGGAIGG